MSDELQHLTNAERALINLEVLSTSTSETSSSSQSPISHQSHSSQHSENPISQQSQSSQHSQSPPPASSPGQTFDLPVYVTNLLARIERLESILLERMDRDDRVDQRLEKLESDMLELRQEEKGKRMNEDADAAHTLRVLSAATELKGEVIKMELGAPGTIELGVKKRVNRKKKNVVSPFTEDGLKHKKRRLESEGVGENEENVSSPATTDAPEISQAVGEDHSQAAAPEISLPSDGELKSQAAASESDMPAVGKLQSQTEIDLPGVGELQSQAAATEIDLPSKASVELQSQAAATEIDLPSKAFGELQSQAAATEIDLPSKAVGELQSQAAATEIDLPSKDVKMDVEALAEPIPRKAPTLLNFNGWEKIEADTLKFLESCFEKYHDRNDVVLHFGNIMLERGDMDALITGKDMCNGHIDGFMFLLQDKIDKGLAISHKYLYISPIFSIAISKKWNYQGLIEHLTKESLPAADYLFVPVHCPGHWTLLVVHLKEKKFRFYDSLINDVGHIKSARPIINELHKILKRVAGYMTTKWKVTCVSKAPQQSNHDCGMFVCKYMEALVLQEKVKWEEHENWKDSMDLYRIELAVDLYKRAIGGS